MEAAIEEIDLLENDGWFELFSIRSKNSSVRGFETFPEKTETEDTCLLLPDMKPVTFADLSFAK